MYGGDGADDDRHEVTIQVGPLTVTSRQRAPALSNRALTIGYGLLRE